MVAGVTCSARAKRVSTVGPLQTSLPVWPGCYHIVLLWECGAAGVPAGPPPHPTEYKHKEVAGVPSQRANSPSAVLGDELRIVGIRCKGGVSQCSLCLLQLNDKKFACKGKPPLGRTKAKLPLPHPPRSACENCLALILTI